MIPAAISRIGITIPATRPPELLLDDSDSSVTGTAVTVLVGVTIGLTGLLIVGLLLLFKLSVTLFTGITISS